MQELDAGAGCRSWMQVLQRSKPNSRHVPFLNQTLKLSQLSHLPAWRGYSSHIPSATARSDRSSDLALLRASQHQILRLIRLILCLHDANYYWQPLQGLFAFLSEETNLQFHSDIDPGMNYSDLLTCRSGLCDNHGNNSLMQAQF